MSNLVWFAFGVASCLIVQIAVTAIFFMLARGKVDEQLEDDDNTYDSF